MEHEECGECAAEGRLGPCSQLFEVLLALDHERRQPWAAYHSVNVACYLLQHPSQTTDHVHTGQWHIVNVFVSEGLNAVRTLAARAVRDNRRRHDHRSLIGGDEVPTIVVPPMTTIEDVSVDGSFPADGYEDRMRAWAVSTARSRGANV